MSSPAPSFWCYRCAVFVSPSIAPDHIACPHCRSGFLEEILSDERLFIPPPPAATSIFTLHPHNSFNSRRQGFRRRRRNARSSFNPVIVLRAPAHAGDRERSRSFQLFYDGGDGAGLQPLPANILEVLLRSGFDRLLDQFLQTENNAVERMENLPASKKAIGSMPTIEIGEEHVSTEAHCAICKEAFEGGSEARQMPCNHIYHSDCIVPWLSRCNSCPVCRNELPSDESSESGQIDEQTIGLTIWRLPGGDLAVGRFPNDRGDGERQSPVVYREMDDVNGVPTRVSQAMRSIRLGQNRGLSRLIRNVLAFFCRLGCGSTSSSSSYSIPRNGSMSGVPSSGH